MTLPRHIPAPKYQLPLITDGLGAFALAGIHYYYRLQNDAEKCQEIESQIALLPEDDRKLILKLKFYKPII